MTLVDLPEIEPLDRLSMYAQLALVSFMEPDTEEVMQERAVRQLQDEHDSPHERPWHVSFHASQFPGDPVDACERYLVYRMMNVPASEPMPPWVTATGVVGKAGELDVAEAWYEAGRLLAVPESVDDRGDRMRAAVLALAMGDSDLAVSLLESPTVHQLGFRDPDHWLTGSVDLPVLKRGWRKPYIVEIKGKASEVLDEMLTGRRKDGTMAPTPRGPDEAHVRQIKASLGLAHEHDWGEVTVCASCWRIQYADIFAELTGAGRINPAISTRWAAETNLQFCYWCGAEQVEDVTFQLEPPDCGEIYYWSRSWPRTTKSFFITHDDEFMRRGREVLASARDHFIAGTIPPRPSHFQWSIAPCGNCSMRPSCRLDAGLAPRKRKPDKALIRTILEISNATDYARSVRPTYDYEKVRQIVLDEWS